MNRLINMILCCAGTATVIISCNAPTAPKSTMNYSLPAEDYQPRLAASDPAAWKPVQFTVTVPTGDVEVAPDGLFMTALERNTHYLISSFSNDHILYAFRKRAGDPNPPDDRPQLGFWDTDLRGSSAGRFMMGAGNTLRWREDKELRTRLNDLIDGIEACQDKDGYLLAYPHIIDSMRSEEANYARSWFTHGLIDAGIAGNPKAFGLLRQHADWFNKWDELHPKLLHWHHNSHQGHIASTRTYLSPVGKPEDLQLAEKFYVCDWWMDELAARHDSAVWQYPLQNPHSYLVTSFEAYLDHYIATGDKTYLNAALGAWDLMHDNWEHVGGSMAICEAQWFVKDGHRKLMHWDGEVVNNHPPKSYRLRRDGGDTGHTGETCGSAFWIKFNQRLHRLYPDNEKYAAEIEKSIYNIILAIQTDEGSIIYHANMEGHKDHPHGAANTCCEGQGTRLLGSLPEYIYSIASDGGLYVNLYEPSTIRWKSGKSDASLKQETKFPYSPDVSLTVSVPSPLKMKLRVRIPSWAAGNVELNVNGKKAADGKPGSYAVLNREWNAGDRISFSLPMELKTTKYTGSDSVAGANRYAVEYGPVLLASIDDNASGNPMSSVINLKADPARPLHFITESAPERYFMPYLLIKDEKFHVYPVIGSVNSDFVFEKHVAGGFAVEFFSNGEFKGEPVYKGTVPSINYPNERVKPIAPKVPVEHFSSRFAGAFTSPYTGNLGFAITTDDGYALYVNDKEVSRSSKNTNGVVQCDVPVVKGEKYSIKFEHVQGKGDYCIILKAFQYVYD